MKSGSEKEVRDNRAKNLYYLNRATACLGGIHARPGIEENDLLPTARRQQLADNRSFGVLVLGIGMG